MKAAQGKWKQSGGEFYPQILWIKRILDGNFNRAANAGLKALNVEINCPAALGSLTLIVLQKNGAKIKEHFAKQLTPAASGVGFSQCGFA